MEKACYDASLHLNDCLVTWRDAGWLEKGNEKAAEEFIGSGSALVGLENGRAVALATSGKGSLYHCLHSSELPFCSINSVNVSFHGRKLGYAAALTSALLAEAAERGDACAGLGMFEQGFYDRLGFSNMPYWKSVSLVPSDIDLKGEFTSRPVRLSAENWMEIHRNRTERYRHHGSVNLSPASTRAAMAFSGNCFALGFRNETGRLTHHIFFEKISGENGPAYTGWLVYGDPSQFRDLMLVVKSLGDQIDTVRISEPPGVQLQALLKKPLSNRRRTLKTLQDRVETRALSWTQCRILSLEGCINGMNCPGGSCSFNLRLHDPISEYLESSGGWSGCSGDYTVSLSGDSRAVPGIASGLPMMECSVNTFTKLWNGSVRPTLIPFTDSISAPLELLVSVEQAVPMPEPSFDWEL